MLYGLRLDADGPIPGLMPSAADAPVDVRISLNTEPLPLRPGGRRLWYRSGQVDGQGRPNLVIWRTMPEGAFHFAYDSGTEFVVAPDGSRVWCAWPEGTTLDDAAVFLRGPVLGFVLRLRNVVCLHASAVAVGETAVAIVGAQGSGKSSTAAAFLKLGFQALADDVAALQEAGTGFRVLPGYPRLNLWPDAAEALYGSAEALPRVVPSGGIHDWWDKRYLSVHGASQFQETPLPLAAVYVLGDRADGGAAPAITPLSGQEAFMALVERTYVNYALDEGMRAVEFRILGGLVRAVPVRLVVPPDNTARLIEVSQEMLRDLDAVTARDAPPAPAR